MSDGRQTKTFGSFGKKNHQQKMATSPDIGHKKMIVERTPDSSDLLYTKTPEHRATISKIAYKLTPDAVTQTLEGFR